MAQTTQQLAIAEILESCGFDFIDAWEIEKWQKDSDDFSDKLQERISEQEIVYYSKAMDYLRENDTSLQESMELASDFGYETKNLNSELLATLHYQNALSQKVGECADKLTEFFANVEKVD